MHSVCGTRHIKEKNDFSIISKLLFYHSKSTTLAATRLLVREKTRRKMQVTTPT